MERKSHHGTNTNVVSSPARAGGEGAGSPACSGSPACLGGPASPGGLLARPSPASPPHRALLGTKHVEGPSGDHVGQRVTLWGPEGPASHPPQYSHHQHPTPSQGCRMRDQAKTSRKGETHPPLLSISPEEVHGRAQGISTDSWKSSVNKKGNRIISL